MRRVSLSSCDGARAVAARENLRVCAAASSTSDPPQQSLVFEQRRGDSWEASWLQCPGIVASFIRVGFIHASASATELIAVARDVRFAADYVVTVKISDRSSFDLSVAASFWPQNWTSLRGGHDRPRRPHTLELELNFEAPEGEEHTTPMRWLPNLHQRICKDSDGSCFSDKLGLATDHFFRSPAVIGAAGARFFALLPDLGLLATQQRSGNYYLPHALDLHVETKHSKGMLTVNDKRVQAWYGLASARIMPHMYTRRDGRNVLPFATSDVPLFRARLLMGAYGNPSEILQRVTGDLWDDYGRQALTDSIKPQVLPFEGYARKYLYDKILFDESVPDPHPHFANVGTTARATSGTMDGHTVWGVNNRNRHGTNFHAWENDVCIAFGIFHFAAQWGNASLAEVAKGMLQLSLLAPSVAGAFPTIYNWDLKIWEGTLWFAQPRDIAPLETFDQAAMGVTSWWQLYHLEHGLVSQDMRDTVLQRLERYAIWVANVMLHSGAVPTYFSARDLSVYNCGARWHEGGCVAATTAIAGAVVAKVALLTGKGHLRSAAMKAGAFVSSNILPEYRFFDFETFFSCAWKPVNWTDDLAGINPMNTLSIGWTADQFLALHQLTGDSKWLHEGEHALAVLNLFQQVWSPPNVESSVGYLYGGFGVMNTDAEWNDREHRCVPTLVDYYFATGKLEYLERAVAAARAGFALMHMQENHDHHVNLPGSRIPGQGKGYAPENVLHGGSHDQGGFTGFTWGGGGAATAAAFLLRGAGGVYVDMSSGTILGIDGVKAAVTWSSDRSSAKISVHDALPNPSGDNIGPRLVQLRFGRRQDLNNPLSIVVNGQDWGTLSTEELSLGIPILVCSGTTACTRHE